MDIKLAVTVFPVIFVAELGDKTQLATLLFASDKGANKLTVFVGASLALIVAVGIAVLGGSFISQYVGEKLLRYIAGCGFVAIGVWTVVTA